MLDLPVADCSQAGIGYTRGIRCRPDLFVADCSQAGIGYTNVAEKLTFWGLRIARRLGSVTLPCWGPVGCFGCGLLAGWDRLHLW